MSKVFRIWQSVLAGLQVIAGSVALVGLVGEKPAGWIIMIVGAAQIATAAYAHGQAGDTMKKELLDRTPTSRREPVDPNATVLLPKVS